MSMDLGYLPEKLDELETHLKKLVSAKKLQCASYILSRHDKVLACRSMGKLRCNDETREFKTDSIRRIASITKMFVAVSIMQLVEKGLIRLDQAVMEILDEFKPPMYEKITIFHLLTHTSGIRPDPGVFFEPYPIDWSWNDKKEWIKEVLKGPLCVEPGKEWRYSSVCFSILGEIVTRVSGTPFEKYVMDNITGPLGMTSSFFDVPEKFHNRVCFTNKWEEEWFHRSTERPDWAPPRGGGGLFSTLEDLQKFGQMLINKGTLNGVRILSRKTVESMTRNHLKNVKSYCWDYNGMEMEYGLGFNVYSNNTLLSPGSFSHEGAGLSGLYMDPVENVVFAYMCPMVEGQDWVPEAVINLRNIAWSGIL